MASATVWGPLTWAPRLAARCQFWVILQKRATANSFTRASSYALSSKGHTSTTVCFDKKIRSAPHFLQPPSIDKEPESNAKMHVNQTAWRDGAKKHTGAWAFFSNAVFNHFPLEDFLKPAGIPTRVRKTTVRTTPVRSQQCECQQCERVNSANANSANATAVRMSAVRMRQQCERRFSELCKTYRSLSFFFFLFLQKLLLLFASIFDLKCP